MAHDDAPWQVLLVDDEPGVLQSSRLILDDLRFEGRRVALLGAGSAAEAREVLAREPGVALVLLDVVMETDDAGLALVQHIRERFPDSDMQIVLRTGQPGMAPEREIVAHYEINGYVLKTDVTSQRLQSIVIASLRSHRHARSLRAPRTVGEARPSQATTELARELARAAAADAVVLLARPEVELASNRITGIELVPQWSTPMGMMSAARVVDALPDGPARRAMAASLLARACHWATAWQAGRARPVRVSIPLVGETLADCDGLRSVLDAVRDARLPAGSLDLLVREATLLSGHPDMRAAVSALRAAGVTLTLDDFGAQTLPLHRLSRLVPDRLKIHRLFVRDLAGDPERMGLARSLIALAHSLNIVAIADGIASDGDAQCVKWEGCDLGQGDALAPACAPADVADRLRGGAQPSH